MSASSLAQNTLGDMWEYGRLLLIAAVGAVIWGSILKKSEQGEEQSFYQSGILFIVLGLVGTFVLLSFVNVQSNNLIALMHAEPCWSLFTGTVGSSVLLFILVTVYKLVAVNRKASPISIRETDGALHQHLLTSSGKVIISVLLLLLITSIVWLWRLSK